MYHVSAQGVGERMINVHYYYYYVPTTSHMQTWVDFVLTIVLTSATMPVTIPQRSLGLD